MTFKEEAANLLKSLTISNLDYFSEYNDYENKAHPVYLELQYLFNRIFNIHIIEVIQWYKKNTNLIEIKLKSYLMTLIDNIYSNDFVILSIITGYGSTTSYSSLKNKVINTILDMKQTHNIDYISFPIEECNSNNKEFLLKELNHFDKGLYYKNKGIVFVFIHK